MFGYDWPRLHAALNDLPAALLLIAALFELLSLATRRDSFRQVSFWTLIVGALGGVAAVLSGLQAEENIAHGDAVHRVMETHELLGFITLGVFGVLAAWRIWREQKMGAAERAVALAVALGGAGVLIATANYGGRLVFDHAAGIPTEVLTNETQERTKGHHHAPGEEHGDRGRGPCGRRPLARRRADGDRLRRAIRRRRIRPCGSAGHPTAQPRAQDQGAGRAQSIRPAHRLTSTSRVRVRAWLVAAAVVAACRPNTTRPAITPYPEAAGVEIRLRPIEATRRLAEALQADSIPPSRVRLRDGYIETAWLDSATNQPTTKRPIGTGVVRLRAWADPGRPGNSVLTVETLYRPAADPSLSERELERQVPQTHPTALKVVAVLEALLKRHGGPPPPAAEKPEEAPRGLRPAEEAPAEGAAPKEASPD